MSVTYGRTDTGPRLVACFEYQRAVKKNNALNKDTVSLQAVRVATQYAPPLSPRGRSSASRAAEQT